MREPRGVSLPWRRAPKAALTGKLTLIVAAATALLSCFLATSAVLIASASGGAAVDYQAATTCPDAYGPVFSRAGIAVDMAPAVVQTIRRQAAAHGFPQPVASMYSGILFPVDLGPADNRKIVLAYRDGGLDHLAPQTNAGRPGLWVGDDLTRFSPVKPGDPVQLAGLALPAVAGSYRALSVPPPRWWCSQQNNATVYLNANDPINSIVFAGDQKTFTDAITTMGLPALANLYLSFYLDPPRTTEQARANLDRSHELIAAVDADLKQQGLGDSVAMQAPFERSVQIAEQAQSNVLVSILPLAAISVLVGCAGIGVVALQWYQRRYAQVRLLASRGASPAALGGMAVAELGLPVALGGVLGILVARFWLPLYAPPGELAPAPQVGAAGIAFGVLLVSLLLLCAVVALRAHRELQVGRVPRRSVRWRLLALCPWELVTAGVAVLGWTRLSGYGVSSRTGTPLPQIDPLALTYPVFVVLTVGLVAARLVWLLLRASHRVRLWSKPPLQLAIRRLAGARAPVTGVLVIGVLAIGTLAAGNGIAAGQRTALETKTGILVGAASRVDVETKVGLGTTPLPAALTNTSTVAGRTSGTGSVVLVVDPANFAEAAYLGSLQAQVSELLPKLASPVAGGLPAIRVGHTASQSANLPGLPHAVTVADLPWFPILGSSPGYVVSRTALTPAQLATIPQWSLLSQTPLEQVSGALAAAGLVQVNRTSQDGALDALPFYVVEWTFSFVTVLGGVLGVVAVLALLVAVEVRRRQNALAGALVLRMGLGIRALFGSHLIELGALAGLAVLAGVACGVTVAQLAVPRFDPVRWLAPRSALPDQTPFVLALVAAGVLVALLAGWIAVRSVRTARTAELLRG